MGILQQSQASLPVGDSRWPQDIAAHSNDTAQARAMLYHALAEALAGPTPETQAVLLDAATTGARVLGSTACQKAALTLAELPAINFETLRKNYTRLIAKPGRRPVALYESLHRQNCLVGQVTWEVERHYRALGLAPVEGELPDHASVELAYLGHLATAEVEARAAGNNRLVARLRREQRYFLRTHAGTWLPEVGTALAYAASADPFYAAVGHLLNEFLAEERTRRKRNGQTGIQLPALKDPSACTLCGLCVGSCPLGALRVVESVTETALTLNPGQCIGCNRCARTCPEKVLFLSLAGWTDNQPGAANETNCRVMRQSSRANCPNCGRPTVSQAELEAVFARLQPDPAVQQRLCLCIECKSWIT
jgi:TorA maturation chaperone TorD/Fe-S-cluster-containing hydrogenase component 2